MGKLRAPDDVAHRPDVRRARAQFGIRHNETGAEFHASILEAEICGRRYAARGYEGVVGGARRTIRQRHSDLILAGIAAGAR